MDVVIVFILALIEIRTPQSDEVKLPRGDGPVEHLRFLRVQQGPISSQRAAPRACLSLVWAAACLGRPRCLRKSLCPNSPLPPELPPCALPECSHLPLLLEHRMTVTNSILLAEQMSSISGKCTHHSFSGMNGGRGGSFLFRLLLHPFPRPPAVGILPSIQKRAALPPRPRGSLRANMILSGRDRLG